MSFKAKNFIYYSLILLIFILNGCGSDRSDSILAYIPADSVVYMGSKEPFPIKESMIWSHNNFPLPDSYYELLQSEAAEGGTDGQKFLNHFLNDYFKLIANPELLDTEWGIAPENQFTFYTLGLAPVLRLNLSNIERFEKKITDIETSAGVKSEEKQLGEARYRRYLLGDDEKTKVWLIIGVDKNDVVFTVDLGVDSEKNLSIALGQSKPENSLASSGQIDQILNKYGFSDDTFLVFINQKELINGITSTDANRTAKMIHFFEQLSGKDSELSELRSPGCRKDMLAIADNWPRTVLAYDKFDFKADPVELDILMITEINDKSLLDGLKSINGFIPEFVSGDELKIFSFGLGLDLDNLAPFLTQQLVDIKKSKYQCSLLIDMQQNLASANPGMLAIATAMVKGVKGFSMTLNEVETGTASPQGIPNVKKLDGILTLSANDTKKLVMAAKALTPMLSRVKVPLDGSAFEIPLPLPIAANEKVMGYVKDSHLAVYVGESATRQAKQLSQSALNTSPSFFSMQMDYGKYYGMIFDSMPETVKQSPEMIDVIAMMKNVDMFVDSSMNITDDGLVFRAQLKTPKKESN